MNTRSKIVTTMLAAVVLSVGMASVQAAGRPGSGTPKKVTASRPVQATAVQRLGKELVAVVQGTVTAGEMTRILHKYGL